MKNINYFNSVLDMSSPLERRRILYVKGNKARSGDSIQPTIEISIDSSLSFMAKAVEQINTSIKAKFINLPEGVAKSSKYKPKIT